MVRIVTLIISLLFANSTWAITKVTASVDKNPVVAKESFILEVVVDDDVDANMFDNSALFKDFIVGNTSVSRQTQMINFKTSKETRWTTLLIAKTPGVYIIPAFQIDDKSSLPIKLTVVEASEQENKSQELFVTTDISATEVYVQQQVTLTVKLHFSAELKRGSLTEPEIEGANVEQIGKDEESVELINGIRYRVITRNYSISPQKSGQFTIKTPIFSGEIVDNSRRSAFASFGQGKPVSFAGEDIELTVKPMPQNYQGQWLPSELVSLHDEWQSANNEFKVGEPITRTITLTAAGLSEEQLPTIEFATPDNIKIYPEQATTHSSIRNGLLISQKVRNFAVVVTKAGQYTLPDLVIPWWNTKINKYQEAVIPGKTITVLPSEYSQTATNVANAEPVTTNEQPVTAHESTIVYVNSWLQWLFLAGWLGTAAAWYWSSKYKLTSKSPTASKKDHASYQQIINACHKHDGNAVLNLLPIWVNQRFSTQFTLLSEALVYVNNPALTEQINQLQASLYAKDTLSWQGDSLKSIIKDIQCHGISNNKDDTLQLNPI